MRLSGEIGNKEINLYFRDDEDIYFVVGQFKKLLKGVGFSDETISMVKVKE